MYEADANSQKSPFVKLTGVNLAGDYTITMVNHAPHTAAAEAFIKFLLGSKGQKEMKADHFEIVSPAKVSGSGVPSALSSVIKYDCTDERQVAALASLARRPAGHLPRVPTRRRSSYVSSRGSNEGWNAPGLWSALRVSVVGATASLLIGVLTGVPLAYVLARRDGWLSSVGGVLVQLPLAVPPLITGIILIYIVGPYSFLGQLSGQRLTETIWGLIIAQSFVSIPFLVVVARSAFRAVDPSLGEVGATLGHGPVARFLRVDVPAASDGIRTGMILMWLRAFGEYGTVVILAYHPYSLPVYVDNLFSSAPLSQADAPTVLAFVVAGLAIALSTVTRLRPRPPCAPARPVAPSPTPPTPVGFESAHRRNLQPAGGASREQPQTGSGRTVGIGQVADVADPGGLAANPTPRRSAMAAST